jgi:hypothetical protein
VPNTVTALDNTPNVCWYVPKAGGGNLLAPTASIFGGRVHMLVGNAMLPPSGDSWFISGFRLKGTRYLLVA